MNLWPQCKINMFEQKMESEAEFRSLEWSKGDLLKKLITFIHKHVLNRQR